MITRKWGRLILGRLSTTLRSHWQGMLKRSGEAFRHACSFGASSESLRAFAKFSAISLVVVALMEWPYEPLARMHGAAMSAIDKLRANLPVSGQLPGFSFVMIDDATHDLWGRSVPTPRDKLVELIDVVSTACPAVIIVDLVFDSPSQVEPDSRLASYINTYGVGANQFDRCTGGSPTLVLPVLSRESGTSTRSNCTDVRCQETSILDEIEIGQSVRWGSASLMHEPGRGIRFWCTHEDIVSLDHTQSKVPSIPLLAVDLWKRRNLVADTDTTLQPEGRSDVLRQPIYFRIPWDVPAGSRPVVRSGKSDLYLPNLTIFSATHAQAAARTPMFENRIVVIGVSYEDSGDWHETPLGIMPGGVVLINAANSYAEHGEITEPSSLQTRWFLASVVLVSGGLMQFLIVSGGIGPMLAGIVASAVFVFPSYLLQGSGFELPFELPAFAGTLATIGEELVDVLRRVSRHILATIGGWK